ncbi:MAG: hypothetical protein E7369_01895, partial [Clostridiales bacterium]|nr:hypothetical protein [Clostridiales bacterium]
MKNNEFYTPKEFNKTSEFMRFSPELYLTPPQNKPQVEVPFTGQEHSTDKNHQSQNGQGGAINKNKPKKSNATGKDSSLQKIMDFATKAGTTVVTTATAAAISVTSLTGLFTPKPTIDLLSLTAGQNSVSYEFVIDDMDSNIDYSVKIENAYHSFEIPIESNEVSDTVDGLREFNSYGFNIVGEAGDGSGEIVYF